MAKNISVDKVYKLKIGSPLSYTLASRNHPRFPLMWFDEKNNQNRALRYATNQKSPFEDEQDGNAIIESIVFEDGFLRVPKQILYYNNFFTITHLMVLYLLRWIKKKKQLNKLRT